MSMVDDIKRMEEELQWKKNELTRKQNDCHHEWAKPIRDDEKYIDQEFDHYETHGVDMWPATRPVEKTRKRYSRYCHKCEKKEYTYEEQPTAYEPKF